MLAGYADYDGWRAIICCLTAYEGYGGRKSVLPLFASCLYCHYWLARNAAYSGYAGYDRRLSGFNLWLDLLAGLLCRLDG
jgi:hypothetical protein